MGKLCYCGSEQLFSTCCEPYILNHSKPPSAEGLMRSRYSAYAAKNYHYIFDTYAADFRTNFTPNDLALNDEGTRWLKLNVLNTSSQSHSAIVEFKAFYLSNKQFYVMHEISEFIFAKDQWFYTTGESVENKAIPQPGRNEACFCGHDKKFKKCCGKLS